MATQVVWLQHATWRGVTYKPGDGASLSDGDADRLVRANYAAVSTGSLPPKPADPLPQYVLDSELESLLPARLSEASLSAAIAEAIADALADYQPSVPTVPTRATITVPAGNVGSALTGFPVRVNLADLGDTFWTNIAADGSDLRVRDGATDLPFDLIRIDKTARTGELFFRANLATTAKSFTVGKIAGATAPAPADPLGRRAVWADFDAMYIGADLIDRTDDTTGVATVASGPYYKATRISPDVHVHQGVARDNRGAGAWIAVDTNTLVRYDANWNEVARNSNPIASSGIPLADHCGGACVVGAEVFVPIQKYPYTTLNNQWIVVYDADTLAFKRKHDISSRATDPSALAFYNGVLWAPNFVANNNIDRYTVDQTAGTLTYLDTVTVAAGGPTNRQGIVVNATGVFISSQTNDALWRHNLDGTDLRILEAGMSTSRAGAIMEGITSDAEGNLYPLWADAPGGVGSRVYRYQPKGERIQLDGVGYATLAAVPKRTQWTAGVSYRPWRLWNTGLPRRILMYGASDATGANTAAAQIIQDTTGKYSLTNSTNGALNGTTTPVLGTRVRLHQRQDGASSRELWVNGVQEAVGASAQRPGALGDRMLVGHTDAASASQRAAGAVDYVYLRNGLLPAAWLAAEQANWETPGFYTVDA